MCVVAVLVCKSTTEIVLLFTLLVYAKRLSGETFTFQGARPKLIVVATASVAVLITESEFPVWLATIILVPSGVAVMPCGFPPTEMVAITVFVAVEIFDTVLLE